MSKALMKFLKDYNDLQSAAKKRRDDSFASVDNIYLSKLQQLAIDQTSFKKRLREMPSDEKEHAEQKLKLRYAELTQEPQWEKLSAMKELFNTVDSTLTKWLMNSYIQGYVFRAEDIRSRLLPAIAEFKFLKELNLLKKKQKITDLAGLKGLEDFLQQENRRLREETLIHDAPTYEIYHPKTKGDSCYLGKDTDWCTAKITQDYWGFAKYNKDGPLYIIKPKTPAYDGEQYQVHFGTDSYKNESDYDVHIQTLNRKFPDFQKAIKMRIREEMENLLDRVEELGYTVIEFRDQPMIIEKSELIDLISDDVAKNFPDMDIDTEFDLDSYIARLIMDADDLVDHLSDTQRERLKVDVAGWGE